MDIKEALARLVAHTDLDDEAMTSVMQQVMGGHASEAQIGGFLIALRMKGETVDEVAAAARVMRDLATSVAVQGDDLVDIVGTGGDASSTFNVSTCCAIVCAAAGARVAKHGNRSVSSKSGAADLLEQAGVNINLDADQVAQCIDEVGVGFMFAPLHHSAMKHAIGPRKAMAVRTIFNLLGPLTNPAGVKRQLLGVYEQRWVKPVAEVLKKLGSQHVMVVHGHDGMDEISVSGPTHVAHLKNGAISEYEIQPEQFGIAIADRQQITVNSAAESLAMVESVLADKAGPARNIVVLNSGAALCVAGIADTIEQGVAMASKVITDGIAREKLDALVACTQRFA